MITDNYSIGIDGQIRTGLAQKKHERQERRRELKAAKLLQKAERLARNINEFYGEDKPLDYFDIPDPQGPYEFVVCNSTTNDITAHIFDFK